MDGVKNNRQQRWSYFICTRPGFYQL